MRYLIPVALVAICASMASAQELKLDTVPQKASYAIGRNIGDDIANPQVPFDVEALIAGIRDSMTGQDSKLSEEDANKALQAFQELVQSQMQRQADENVKKGQDYLAKTAEREGVTKTQTGLLYEVLKEGTGPMPTLEDTVECHYKGVLLDGTQFDSSYDRGQPAQFPVQGVIPGWTEALQKMKVGSKWKLHIPAELAYGAQGRPSIPPNSVLVFEVELLKIVE